jgi:serine protease Do
MDKLTKTQFVLLVLLVSFVTSLATAIVTATLVNQAPPPLTQTIHKVIEKTIVREDENKDKKEKNTSPLIITQEDLIIKLVQDVNSSVVSVVATKDLPVIEQFFVDPFGDDEFFRKLIPPELLPQFQIPQYRQKGTEKRQISSGSGFLISEDGLIITNKHVVEDKEAEYSIIMNNGKKLSAQVLARDPFQDVAILKVSGAGFSYIPLGNSDTLKVGQTVVAIGNTLGEFQNTVSVGVISGLKRTVLASGSTLGPQKLQEVIQTDAAINPGNSGGPLLDLQGRVIGINTAMASGAENVGFALPINIIKKDVRDVKKFGKIKNAFLGVRYISINQKIKEEKKLAVDYGILLEKSKNGDPAVIPESPAEKAGLQDGDIILEFDGVKINQNNTLGELISKKSVGEKIKLKILRDGQEMILEVILGERPENI